MPKGSETDVRSVLGVAVDALGGQERSGQVEMAEAVAAAMASSRHLMVQAGTGTGKSLAYLVPALVHEERVVVATATLALQHQLVERDIPRLVEAVKDVSGIDSSHAVLKGRSNYACLHRMREGVPDEQGALVDVPVGSMAEKVLELRAWGEEEAEAGGSGERDNAPRHTDREWRQVSVTHRECLGAAKCPFGAECFAELAKEKAARSHLVVTNHSLLAIDNMTRGLAGLDVDRVPMEADLDGAWEVLGEAVQQAMRAASIAGATGMEDPYERLKELTRGRAVTAEAMREFITSLGMPSDVEERLAQLTPASYTGLASDLVAELNHLVPTLDDLTGDSSAAVPYR